MKATYSIILIFLLSVSSLQAQEALKKYTNEIANAETMTDETKKSDNRGKALATFFDSRTIEAGKQTATNETVPFLRKLVDYDFHAAYNFFMKIKNVDDAKMFMQNHLSKEERTLISSMANAMVSNYNSSSSSTYPASIPKPGNGLKGKWMPTSNNSIAQTDNGNTEFNKGYEAYNAGNYAEALKWFTQSAEKGNASAMLNLGVMYKNGKGVSRNDTEAFNWYKQSADKGNAAAMYNLATLYQYGEGVTKNHAEAMNWFKKAADKDNVEAMYSVGTMYEYGSGVTKNTAEAKAWYQKAANKGHQYAKQVLQKLSTSNNSSTNIAPNNTTTSNTVITKVQTNDGKDEADKGFTAEMAKNYSEALKWYQLSADKGNGQGMYGIGMAYLKGQGVEKNEKEAIVWLQKAAEKGDVWAVQKLHNLGIAPVQKDNGYAEFKKGSEAFGAKNYTDAMKYYKQAADKGNADAMAEVGWLFMKGNGVDQCFVRALEWYEKAVQGNSSQKEGYMKTVNQLSNGTAELMDGNIFYKAKQNDKAKELFLKGEQKGNAQCSFTIGYIYYFDKDYANARIHFQKAADKGYAGAEDGLKDVEIAMAKSNNNGSAEFKKGNEAFDAKNYTEALNWFKQAADKGNTNAMYNLGTMYENGDGIKPDFNKAIKWYQLSVDKGNTTAKKWLEELDKNGRVALFKAAEAHDAKNYTEALKWYKIATDKGNISASFLLKSLEKEIEMSNYISVATTTVGEEQYKNGLKSEQSKNYPEAFKWFKQAADNGNANAMYELGMIYYTGRGGVSKNHKEAKNWFQKAYDKGNTKAKTYLDLLKK